MITWLTSFFQEVKCVCPARFQAFQALELLQALEVLEVLELSYMKIFIVKYDS